MFELLAKVGFLRMWLHKAIYAYLTARGGALELQVTPPATVVLLRPEDEDNA